MAAVIATERRLRTRMPGRELVVQNVVNWRTVRGYGELWRVEAEGRLRLRLTVQLSLKGPDRCRCCQAHRQSPSPRHLRKRTRRQGPFPRRHSPASTPLRPCPTPAMTVACRDVEAATLACDGSPPITRTTFPTCRAHYPGGSSGCACRLLPRSRGLPQMAGGSASALSLSR